MLKWILIIMNFVVAALLVLVHFAVKINPIDFAYTAFLGFLFPILLVLTFLCLLIWLFTKHKWYVLISLIALIITWSNIKATFQLSAQSKTLDEIKLMTWNVKNFDLYNWSGNEKAREEMFGLIQSEMPDILCLQEFYTADKGNFNNLKDVKKLLDYKYVQFAKTYTVDGKRHWGLVIYSKYKITDTGKLTFKEGTHLNTCMFVDLQLNDNQTVRVYNVHLQSNQFSDEDYKFIENITENKPQEDQKGAEKIALKLRDAYVKRAKQCLQVKESIDNSPYPVILCGDFNDTPVSYTYKTFSADLQDAFVKKGMGFGKTYVNPSPFLRIDYAFFNNMFTINAYESIKQKNSDHNPVIVRFKI
ncbi:MAG: endonuclease/exonuclease/phosphatase family protein [Chitinophagales bacterium]|nr:endonuclease/exonuclease/phosphatase family protein [Chitinophagales bacterium]